MGESFINQGINSNGAIIRVIANNNSVITCTDGKSIYKKKCIDNIVEFKVGYGSWTITSKIDNRNYEKTVSIKTLKKYEVSLTSYTYGIRIDMNNGNPATAVTYIDDAVGFTPLAVDLSTGVCNYGSWEDIILNDIGCRPCLLRSTTVNMVKYLNPNDYTKFEDGTPADITSGTSGNVMVEFKKTWYKFEVNGNILTFQVANYDRSKDGFVCSAFKSMDGSGKVKDYMYYGAYEGCIDEQQRVRSTTGRHLGSGDIFTYTKLQNFKKYVQNNGSSYGLEDWCKRCYLLGLLMLVTKTRDIQSAIGYGHYTYNRSMENSLITGTLDQAGLFAGYDMLKNYNTSNKTYPKADCLASKGVKAFGIENLWGSCSIFCDGIITNSIYTIGVKESAPYDPYTGREYIYINNSSCIRGDLSTPTTMTTALNGAVIIPLVTQSDNNSIGWCDQGHLGYSNSDKHKWVDNNSIFYVGGLNSGKHTNDGPFSLFYFRTMKESDNAYAVRLVFC